MFWVYQNGNFLPGKGISHQEKNLKNDFAPLEKFSCYAPLVESRTLISVRRETLVHVTRMRSKSWLHICTYALPNRNAESASRPSPLSCRHPPVGTLILRNIRGTLHPRLRNSAVARQRGNHSNSKLAHHLVDTLMSRWRPLLLTMSICLPWETKKQYLVLPSICRYCCITC